MKLTVTATFATKDEELGVVATYTLATYNKKFVTIDTLATLATSDEERPWEIALLYNQDDRAARHAIRLFGELGMNVGDNVPYSGKDLNATMNRHAEAKGRNYCAITVRQDLIATRAQQSRFAAIIADVCGRVALALD